MAAHSFIADGVSKVPREVTVKTFSNYANHLFQTPLDEKFAAREWSPSAAAA